MIKLPRRGIGNDELDEALAASRRHAAFADSDSADGNQIQNELRGISAIAAQIETHGRDDLPLKTRLSMLWRTAWPIVVAVVVAGAAGAVAALVVAAAPVVATVPKSYPAAPWYWDAIVAVSCAVYTFGPILRFLSSPTLIALLGHQRRAMRSRRQRGPEHGFGKRRIEEGAG